MGADAASCCARIELRVSSPSVRQPGGRRIRLGVIASVGLAPSVTAGGTPASLSPLAVDTWSTWVHHKRCRSRDAICGAAHPQESFVVHGDSQLIALFTGVGWLGGCATMLCGARSFRASCPFDKLRIPLRFSVTTAPFALAILAPRTPRVPRTASWRTHPGTIEDFRFV